MLLHSFNACFNPFSPGNAVELSEHCLSRLVSSRESKILADDGEKAFQILTDNSANRMVDVVMDNAGLEAVADLALAIFIIQSGMAAKVCWFFSCCYCCCC
jgi:hypothetical protein